MLIIVKKYYVQHKATIKCIFITNFSRISLSLINMIGILEKCYNNLIWISISIAISFIKYCNLFIK